VAEHLVDSKLMDYMLYVDFILSRTRNFRLAGVEPVMVFDGRREFTKVIICKYVTLDDYIILYTLSLKLAG
jgi:hypothetical protein